MEKYPETIIPNRAAQPQESYLSELALPFTVISEIRIHDKLNEEDKK